MAHDDYDRSDYEHGRNHVHDQLQHEHEHHHINDHDYNHAHGHCHDHDNDHYHNLIANCLFFSGGKRNAGRQHQVTTERP